MRIQLTYTIYNIFGRRDSRDYRDKIYKVLIGAQTIVSCNLQA